MKMGDKTLLGGALPCKCIFFIMIFNLWFDVPRKGAGQKLKYLAHGHYVHSFTLNVKRKSCSYL